MFLVRYLLQANFGEMELYKATSRKFESARETADFVVRLISPLAGRVQIGTTTGDVVHALHASVGRHDETFTHFNIDVETPSERLFGQEIRDMLFKEIFKKLDIHT